MADQNHSLLLKFVHKLHEEVDLLWIRWFQSQNIEELDCLKPDSYISRIMCEELPWYRSLTRSLVGNGTHTSFWKDRWLLNTTLVLEDTFPALYSHCTRQHISVAAALTTPFVAQFQHRLTQVALEEQDMLLSCLARVSLSDQPDERLFATDQCNLFDTRDVPRALQSQNLQNPDAF